MDEKNYRIIDGRCEHCGVPLIQHTENGAQYVKKRTQLNPQQIKLLSQWLSSEYATVQILKADLRKLCNWKSTGGFDARLSELLSIGTAIPGCNPLVYKSPQEKDGSEKTVTAPLYHMDIERVTHVLNRGGKLD